MTNTYAEALERHYANNWSAPIDRVRLNEGRIDELPSDFRVLVIQQSSNRIACATQCMSQVEDSERMELHMLARLRGAPNPGKRQNPGHAVQSALVELLTIVAHYHRTGSRLGLGHT